MENKIDVVKAAGCLPEKYRAHTVSNPNKFYLIIPLLICICLLWFAYSQWQNPTQIPMELEEEKPKERIWWLPDLLKTLPPFANGYRLEKYSERYNLMSCSINGNLPEINSAIFCYLLNPEKYKLANKTISTDLQGEGLCGNAPPLTLFSHDQYVKYDNISRRIAIIQEPLQRFARQFRRICEIGKRCYDCNNDTVCLMRKVFRDHEKIAEGLSGDVRSYVTNHFSPQTWNCHFNHQFTRIETVKIGASNEQKASFAGSMRRILSEQGVSQDVQDVVSAEIMRIPLALNAHEARIAKSIKSDPDKWTLFRYLYEHDYIVFGFPI